MNIAEPLKLDSRAIQDLMTRVDTHFPPGRGRLIGFIASGSGEGTTTVAQAYARAVATQLRRRVLLLDAGSDALSAPVGGEGSLVGMLAAMAGHTEPDRSQAAQEADDEPQNEVLASSQDPTLWQLLPRTELWFTLRERFDEVVIDLPAPSASRLGMAVAPYCDGVAMVVEAEKTRSPVAESLLINLRSVRARVLGAVLNKRRFHLPARVYRML